MSDDYVKRIERFLDRHGIDDYAAYANRSLSHTGPVSGTSKRKLKNGEQRPAPKTRQLGTASVNFPGQRLWRACQVSAQEKANWSLAVIEPVSSLRKWKLEKRQLRQGAGYVGMHPVSATRRG